MGHRLPSSIHARDERRVRLRRARLRRREGGAVLFIVAVTLGLLAVTGIYGLTATANDVRATGNMREALQGQRAGESALVMTAETFNPMVANTLVANMSKNAGQATNCKSAAVYTGNTVTRAAESCIMLNSTQMMNIAAAVTPANAWPVPGTAQPGFTPLSFGAVADQPFFNVEVTNPVDISTSTGSSASVHYTQLTVTVYVQMKTTQFAPADTIVTGRGRMTVGPSTTTNTFVSNF